MSKKSKPGRIPKSLAGIKIPKDLRKAGDALIEKANSPQGRQVIATGLTMATAAIAAASERRRTEDKPAEPRPDTRAPGAADPQAFGDAIGNAVEQAMRRAFGRA